MLLEAPNTQCPLCQVVDMHDLVKWEREGWVYSCAACGWRFLVPHEQPNG